MFKLNNKGFAISGILYSILILFLLLLTAILGILGSRKAVLDKTKNDVFKDLNKESTLASICVSNSGSVSYELGAPYICDPGDGVARTFYVLEVSENNVSLIMNENLGDTVAWITEEDYIAAGGTNWGSGNSEFGPITANNYLKSQTSNWTVDVTLPTYHQIYNVNNSENFTEHLWLYENLSPAWPSSYWTSTSRSTSAAWHIYWGGRISSYYIDNASTGCGIRPVITLNKTNLS